jgi:hypothetical protein
VPPRGAEKSPSRHCGYKIRNIGNMVIFAARFHVPPRHAPVGRRIRSGAGTFIFMAYKRFSAEADKCSSVQAVVVYNGGGRVPIERFP